MLCRDPLPWWAGGVLLDLCQVWRVKRRGGVECREAEVKIRQANGIGRVHVAKPQMKETYCGRPVDEEEWVTTSREANCVACARAGAPRPEGSGRGE